MKAMVYLGPKTMEVQEIPKPELKPDEVLVRVSACGICGSDVHGYLGQNGRRIPPMVMGHEFAGVIEALGEGVTRGFKAGDRVTVQPAIFCGECENCRRGMTHICTHKEFYGVFTQNGAFAEYVAVPEKLLYHLPDTVSDDIGALIEPLAVSYCGVKKAGDLTGKNVLIVGGGTIGQLALAVARTKNPKKLVLSDLSPARLEFAKKFGADAVINPGEGDFETLIREAFDGELADVSVECVGVGATARQALECLKMQGTSVWIGNNIKMIEIDMQRVVTSELKVFGSYIYSHAEFGEAIDLITEKGMDLTPLITGIIPLEEAPAMFDELLASTERHLKVVVHP